ncbi:MAG: glycosyltransferase [Syntrophobacteraceae bacterium]
MTYLPEYVLPNWMSLLRSNAALWRRLGGRYARSLFGALGRATARRKFATIRHFLQAAHLTETRLADNPSVVHLHAHFCHTPTSVAFFASELTGLPFSFTAHAKDIYTSDPEQLRRKIDKAAFVVTCTRYNARRLGSLSSNGASIHTIYHGIDLDFFSFDPSPSPLSQPFRILTIGRLVPKKGYDVLLAALRLLDAAGMDFEWTQIGDGEIENEVREMVKDFGLGPRTRMLGTLPREEVIDHYRRAHCFALPCKVAENGDRDGIPNVLVESMAVGLPVVSTRVSAIPELVEDGVTGSLVAPEDPEALARAITDVLLHPENHRESVRRARAKVEEDFDNRRNTAHLNALFQKALRR